MHRLTISIGSNTADCREQMSRAAAWCASQLYGWEASPFYTTPDIHGKGPDYLNAVICGQTPLSATEFAALAKEYERSAGRHTHSRTEVEIDIDIVICDGEVLREADYSREYFRKGLEALAKKTQDPHL